MTGGGAKGLYEAGVIHAFHLCGMDFDVITGSSIGAINALFFAEYLLRKKELPVELRSQPEQALEALDDLVMAFLHAWWTLPEAKIIDDTDEGPLGKLKDDLIALNVDLPLLVRLGWWWTDPQRWNVPPPRVWPHLVRLGRELLERLGDGGELFEILKREKHAPVETVLRAYLARFGVEQSLVPAVPNTLRDYFSKPQTPLQHDHLLGKPVSAAAAEELTLIKPDRTFREYRQAGIDLRLTRANYRTGRLELSAYTSIEEFIEYLEGRNASSKLTLGSSRLVVPGNPNGINAAIASGRFPGVFAPFPITAIYLDHDDSRDQPENALLYQILEQGLDNEQIKEVLFPYFAAANPDDPPQALRAVFDRLFPFWTDLPFPRIDDVYIDGGAIDNTPTNSAVDAIREEIDRRRASRRDYLLDLYVVYLHSEPNPGTAETHRDPALHQIVTRTLKIQGAAKMTSDAGVVNTINRFGTQGEELGRHLRLLLMSVRKTLQQFPQQLGPSVAPPQREALLKTLRDNLYQDLKDQAEQFGISKPEAPDLESLLAAIDSRSRDLLEHRLPLHVNPIEIYPDDMQLDTLQFTERLGFRRQNAIEGMTMGCYNTLWQLRLHLESKEATGQSDDTDQQALALARKWMGFEQWPHTEAEQRELEENWPCQRTKCPFHLMHCRHGRRITRVVELNVSHPPTA
jgi:hypothetical protein